MSPRPGIGLTGMDLTSTGGRPEAAAESDRGSVALFMALFTVALIAVAGLVIDGGASLAARGRAHDVAAQAARAGADALSPQSLRASSPEDLLIDPAAAQAAAQQYLRAGHATGTVTVQGQDVTVTARIPRRAVILSAFGIRDISGTSTATATILHGTFGGP
jgi:Flp pilus assembly protein TadG